MKGKIEIIKRNPSGKWILYKMTDSLGQFVYMRIYKKNYCPKQKSSKLKWSLRTIRGENEGHTVYLPSFYTQKEVNEK